MHLNQIHPFYDENRRAFKILVANDQEITKLIDETESIAMMESQRNVKK